MKIGMFGGSFNPIHIGHIELANIFTEKLSLDKLLIIPTCVPPHKASKDMATSSQRFDMCRIAVSDNHKFEVSDIEIKRGGASYTYQTILQLLNIYSAAELFLIIGADMFMTLQDWKNPDIIFKNATICTVPRNSDNYEILLKHSEYLAGIGAKSKILSTPLTQISSTIIRNAIKNNDIKIKNLLPDGVYDYIKNNNLYKG